MVIIAAVFAAQFLTLRGDAHGTGVCMAPAVHNTAQGHHQGRGEAVLLGSEQGADHHVATILQSAVALDAHLAAQVVEDERLLYLGQAQLHGQTGVVHRAGGRGSRSTVGTADENRVRLGLGHAGGDGAHAAFGH